MVTVIIGYYKKLILIYFQPIIIDDFGVNSHLIKCEAILVGVPISMCELHLFGISTAFLRVVKQENYKIRVLGYLKSDYYTQKPWTIPTHVY